MPPHSIGSGTISFGLVSIPIKLYTAASAGGGKEVIPTCSPWRRSSSPRAAKGCGSLPPATSRPSATMNRNLNRAGSSASLAPLERTASTRWVWSPRIWP